MSDRQMFDMAVIEHLGQSALLGQKLSPLEIFERGWQAAQLAEAEKKLENAQPAPATQALIDAAVAAALDEYKADIETGSSVYKLTVDS